MKKENPIPADMLGLCILGVYCVLASFFTADFAKLHANFSFLDFPIFVGEIVLLLCALVFGWLVVHKEIRLAVPGRLFVAYLGGVLLWSAYYYFSCSGAPLALRNTMLFFYPVFALFGYFFYKPSFFSSRDIRVLLSVILFLLILWGKSTAFSFTYLALLFIVFDSWAPRLWSCLITVMSLLVWPHSSFLSGARTWLVAGCLAGFFLTFIFLKYFLKSGLIWKLLTALLIGGGVLWLVLHFADKAEMKTLLSPGEVFRRYEQVKLLVKKEEASYHARCLTPQLYHPVNNQQALVNMTTDYRRCQLKIGTTSSKPAVAAFKFSGGPASVQKSPSHGSVVSVVTPKSAAREHPYGPLSLPALSADKVIFPKEGRDINSAYDSIFFRLLIWNDMLRELMDNKNIFGVGLARPQRSRSLEILQWGESEWERDGWITPHNSFLHLIYRGGIIGVGLIATIFVVLGGLIRDFIRTRSVNGILLCGIVIYWLTAANFLLILELPYYAIPFWSLFGLTMAYRRHLLENKE